MKTLESTKLVVSLIALSALSLHCSGKAEDGGSGSPLGDGDGDGDGDGTGGEMMMDATGGAPMEIDVPVNMGGARGFSGPVDKIDMLFVIDNSVSMADKQEMLRDAVPDMIRYLVDPPCVSADGDSTDPLADGSCPTGTEREFVPVEDIHIGVISSSLGGHGSRFCSRGEPGWNNDDQAHLIGTTRAGVPANEMGFLTWTGGDGAAAEQLISDFTAQVSAVGESGCGFEAPLEAWYRFLVDPQPPEEIVLDDFSRADIAVDANGMPLIDAEVLAQREAFLRPDSLVNIVVLSDENDCSMMDGGAYYNNAGFGYLVAEASFAFPHATSVCEDNPNDACCFSCLQRQSPPEGCEMYANECVQGETIPAADDRANVRCFDVSRRFGVDLLYPTDRYVQALSERAIIDARTGEEVDNPLLMGVGENAGQYRGADRVFFTGIVGVPWQDIATEESLNDPDVLEYLTADELRARFEHEGQMVDRWDVMLGSRGLPASHHLCADDNPERPQECGATPAPPLDPFMIESIVERPAGEANPISGDLIVSSASTDPTANAINGHEANNSVIDNLKYADGGPANDDLQYACIFPLKSPKVDCDPGDLSCDCGDEPLRNRAVCQSPSGGTASTTQFYGKAYPGVRVLEVLRDFGSNSVVSSICPKDTDDGYTPAITTITTRLREVLPTVVK